MRSTHRRSRWQSLSSVFLGRSRPSGTVLRRRVRLWVEGMEDRILLATTTYAAINLINSSGDEAAKILNEGKTFTTSILGTGASGTGDVTIEQTLATPSTDYTDHTEDTFAPELNGYKNPSAVADFVGSPLPPSGQNELAGQALQGTGDGSPGSLYSLLAEAGDKFEIDFNGTPLGSSSMIVFGDIDENETVTVTAYDGDTALSLSNWKYGYYTGETGSKPDPGNDSWATWTVSSTNDTSGVWTSTGDTDLNTPLNVLMPAAGQSVTRLDFSETGVGGVSYQVLSPGSSLTAVSGTGTYGGNADLTATLLSVAGTPLAGATVSFNLMEGGTPTPVGSTTTNNDGVATLPVSLGDFPAGISTNAVMAVFSGDANDSPTTAYGDMDVQATYAAINMLNNGGNEADDVLNQPAAFPTSFLGIGTTGAGDVTIQQTLSTPSDDYELSTGTIFQTASASGNPNDNNPAYLTSFVGGPSQGTGDGTPGSMYSLEAGEGDAFEVQFQNPIGDSSQILIGDLDLEETVTVQAFDANGNPVSLDDWTETNLTGENNSYTDTSGTLHTDVSPDSGVWATWSVSSDGYTGTLTSPTDDQLHVPINQLTPAFGQEIYSLKFTEGGTGNVFYQVINPGSSLTAVAGHGTYGGTGTLTATLLNAVGQSLDDESVSFNLMEGGTPTFVGSATTNKDGVATLPVSLGDFPAGISTKAVMAVFSGDANDSPTTAYGDMDVQATYAAINMVNSTAHEADDVLNQPAAFHTTFLGTGVVGTGDVTIQQTLSTPSDDYELSTGASFQTATASGNPNDNNPTYLTSFVGSPLQGTGDGTPGSMYSLEAGKDDAFEIQFQNPIGDSSQILIGDVDLQEVVTVQAFDANGNPVSLDDWTETNLTGENNSYTDTSGTLHTDVSPDSGVWATWSVSSDGYTGTLTSPTADQLDDPINQLTPAFGQEIYSLKISEAGSGQVLYQVINPGSSLTPVAGQGTYGGTATLTATLLNQYGAPLHDESVNFDLMEGGTPTFIGTATTDPNGVAQLPNVSLAGFSAGVYTGAVMAVFAGDFADSPTTAFGNLTVLQAPLTVTANNQNKVYGGADPKLSYTVTGTFYYGDGPSVVSGVTLSTTTGAAATAGTHTITATGGTATNYAITDVPGTLTVSQAAALTVTADNQSKVYGAADPTLTYTARGTLYYSDTYAVISGVTLSTATGAAATAGTHAITATGGTAANYAITDASGTLTVSQAATLTVTADDKTKIYGGADPTLTYTVTGTFYYDDGPGVVSGVSLATTTGAAATAGTHTITATGGTAANYAVTDATGVLTVSKAPLTVTADDKSKVYGAADPTLTYSASGTLYYTDTYAVISGVTLATATGAAATAGTHAITAAGGTAANYVITDAPGTLTVSKAAALTVTADDKSKVYGGADPTLTYTVTGTFYYDDGPGVVSGVTLATATGRRPRPARTLSPPPAARRPTTPSLTPMARSRCPRRRR